MRNRKMLSVVSAVAGGAVFVGLGLFLPFRAPLGAGSDAVGTADPPNSLQVEITDTGFEPAFLHADPGWVTIEVLNSSRAVHNVSIVGIAATAPLRSGQTETLRLRLVRAGTYEFRCEVSMHGPGAIRGTLLVGPPLIGGHVSMTEVGAENPIEAVHHRERQVSGKYTLHRLYFRWNDELPSSSLIETLEEGRTALVSWNSIGSGLDWSQIAAGKGDTRIREVGGALAPVAEAYPGKVLFAWNHEPEVHVRVARREGIPETGTGSDFVACWQRVFRIFAEEGFRPARALVSDEYDPDFSDGVEFDVLAPDKYLWSPLTPDGRCNRRWASFEEVWKGMRSMFATRFPGKAVLIGETGVQEGRHPVCQPSGDRRAKARWLHAALPAIWQWAEDATNPLVGVGVFDAGSFRVDTSSDSLRAWGDLVAAFQPPEGSADGESMSTVSTEGGS
jgi:plastocyanin